MTIRPMARIGALTLAVSMVAAACGGGGATTAPTTAAGTGAPGTASALSGTVTIDGSSTVFPITQLAAEEFQNANPGVQVPVAESGTGGGFKKFCAGETDINDASRPIKKDDAGEGQACTTNNISYVELLVAIDGLTVVVNPSNSFATCLTKDELKLIYGPDSPEKLMWSEVRAGFPAELVDRYMPGADSGTFDYFTEVINGKVDESTTYATQSEDDNQLVTGVAGSNFSIGYFGYSYYVQNNDKLKAIGVDGGKGCVVPSDTTINDGTYAPLSRPLFIYPNVGEARTRPELEAFIDFYLEHATEFATDPTVGYIGLPDADLAAEVAEWKAAVGS